VAVKSVQVFNGLDGLSPEYTNTATLSARQKQSIEDKEGYIQYDNNYSAEGSQFNFSIQTESDSWIKGRPSVATHLPPVFESSTVEIEQAQKPILISQLYDLITITDDDYVGQTRGTIAYNQARTLDEVKNSAYADWTINNIEKGISVNLTVLGLADLEEGDLIEFELLNIIYQGIVKTIQYTVKILENSDKIKNLQSTTALTVGLLPERKAQDVVKFNLLRKHSYSISSTYYRGSRLGAVAGGIGNNRLGN
jgi:hypothetical protein